MSPVEQPCPPYDQEIVSALDTEIQRLAMFITELPPGPSRENPSRRIVRLRGIMDRYISQHSTAGWPSYYEQEGIDG